MNKVALWLSAVAGASVIALSVSTTACAPSGSCTFTSRCGGDTPMTQDQVTACNNKLNNPSCGGLYSDYLGCFQDKQICTASGLTNETDTNNACSLQYANWQNCCFGTEGGVADGGFPQCGQ